MGDESTTPLSVLIQRAGSFPSTNRWVIDTHHPCHTDRSSQTELHLSQLFLAPCAHDIIMDLLPVKHKSNVVWKSQLSRLPSILLTQEGWWLRSGALWRSKMKVLLLHWNLEPSHVMMRHGLGYICCLSLSLPLLKEIPNLAALKQDINLSMS